MSDKPVNHGFPTPKPREEKKPLVPRALRQLASSGSLTPGAPSEELCKRFGKWKMRALRPHGIGYGAIAKVGDTYEIDGANAVMLAFSGQAEFCDTNKLQEEQRVLEDMKKLGLDKPVKAKDMPEFRPAPGHDHNWRP